MVEGMQYFRDITTRAREAIENCNWEELSQLMTENFEQRRKLYGGDFLFNSKTLLIIKISPIVNLISLSLILNYSFDHQ